jgi:hypothetical protein
MKPNFDHRLAVNMPRSKFCRKTVNKIDKIMHRDKRTSQYYTGLAGRNLCFQFPTSELLADFERHINGMLSSFQFAGVV